MASKKVVISRINTAGSIRQFKTTDKSLDTFDGKSLKAVLCDSENDNKTTYVQKKIWSVTLNDYLFPPYVDCEYVN